MASMTNTTKQDTFRRTDSKDDRFIGIFHFDSDPSRPEIVRITLPEKSTFTVGAHWHERHIEYFKVTKGRLAVKRGGVVEVVTPDSGVQRVDRFVVHDFWRADKDLSEEDKDAGDVITEEWTDPMDGIKQVFFRNVFSVVQDAEKFWGWWTYLQALTVISTYDEFLDILPGRLSYTTTHILYAGVRAIAPLIGLSPWHEEYTPTRLRGAAMSMKNSKSD